MKKTVLAIAAALLVTAAACAAAPELRNMMPNSWEKLTRLTAEEERELFNNDAVKTCTEKRKEYYAGKRNKKTDIRAYSEKCGDLVFYRVLYCNERLDTFLQKEYRNCTITQKEYEYMWDIEMLQSMFIREKNSNLRLIGGTSYHSFWTSQGEWDGFVFSDIMIRQLNESEIGFFVTEASVSFTIDRINDDKMNVVYRTVKNQQAGGSSMYFRKYNLKDVINTTINNDSIRIQASDYLFDSRCPLKYSIQNAFDGNPATSYVENTEDDLMKIEFSGFKSMFNRKVNLAIINGYSSNKELYIANNRILNLNANSYKVSDDKTELILREPISLELQDMNLKYQIVSFDYNNRIGSFSFNVTKIVKGKFYNDTCLAELNLSESTDYIFGDIYE